MCAILPIVTFQSYFHVWPVFIKDVLCWWSIRQHDRTKIGGHCNHIFALYLLNHRFLLGIRELHEMQVDQTCTSVPQQWHKSKGVIIIWLIPRAGKMNQIKRKWVSWSNSGWSSLSRSGLPAASRRKNFPESHITNPFIDQVCPRSFFCETHEKGT